MLQCTLVYTKQLKLEGYRAASHVDQAFAVRGINDSYDGYKMGVLFVSGAANWP